MPIFARRRLQAMLNDLVPYLEESKAKDLISRLRNKRAEQALPAEMEMALLWGLHRLGEMEPEPKWFGTGRLPDAYSELLFPSQPTIVEIAAMLDIALSGEEDMRRVSYLLCEAANKIKRKSGKHLFFYFFEESGYEERTYYRRRKVEKDFTVTDKLLNALATWLKQPPHPRERLHLSDGKTEVLVEWREQKQNQFNFFCSMPSEVHSITENPLYTLLTEKSDQLKNPEYEGIRCVLLADAGSTLLRRLHHVDVTNRTVSGQSIIDNFLSSSKIDVVCVFSPYRPPSTILGRVNTSISWRVTPFFRPRLTLPLKGIERLTAALPKPRFEGYQAKELHQQGLFSHSDNRWYIASNISTGTTMTISISARALLDLLAGHITQEQFIQKTMNGGQNQFKYHLDQGDIITAITVEHGGLDEDDDRFTIKFSRDPSVAPLVRLGGNGNHCEEKVGL